MKGSENDKDAALAKALLLVCWYLGYKDDGDFSRSTRCDVLEEVKNYLAEATPMEQRELKVGRSLLVREFETRNHPFRGDVKAFLDKFLEQVGIRA